ncbi:MAG TPA: MOSC domain-containing protein [Chloroflexota bacterium]|jgi:MOSC domain-containing protein YiiM|nr:MOSC domain-containing protein [Chloroflexota bacterium]
MSDISSDAPSPLGPAAGAAPVGRIVQVSISAGGAPKHAVPRAVVGRLGLEGDRQRMRHHGGPDRAVMVYSVEQIATLRAAGHPIFPGAIGENVTTQGIDLTVAGPGDRLHLGEQVVLEVRSYPKPCDGIGHAFQERDFMQVYHRQHPGMSRLACGVLQGGEIAPGDEVRLVPAASR